MIHSFWTSVFWPYFQFAVFIAALIYFARKPVMELLSSRRDEFRTKLSEAHEALFLAEQKIKQYKEQIDSLTQQIENIENQYKQEAEAEIKKILNEANASANSLLNDAKRAAMELISQTRHELKKEMFALVVKEFEKQLTSERAAALNAKLQEEAIDSIPQALNPSGSNAHAPR